MHQPAVSPHAALDKLQHILQHHHPLCREDMIWMLGYITKMIAEEDGALAQLPQQRLLLNFRNFAEAAMIVIHRSNTHEQDRLKHILGEAAHGLIPGSH